MSEERASQDGWEINWEKKELLEVVEVALLAKAKARKLGRVGEVLVDGGRG